MFEWKLFNILFVSFQIHVNLITSTSFLNEQLLRICLRWRVQKKWMISIEVKPTNLSRIDCIKIGTDTFFEVALISFWSQMFYKPFLKY